MFTRTLEERRKQSERQKARYWSDPEYRLWRINKSRERLGLPPHEHLLDAATRGPNE